MSSPRQPRTSTLARSGLSAIRPPQAAEEQPAPPQAAPATPATTSSAKAAPAAGKQRKVGFYQDPEDAARMRGAYRMTNGQENDRSLSDFIQKAIMAEVERREKLYNGGQPFAAVEPGGVPVGRPEGS